MKLYNVTKSIVKTAKENNLTVSNTNKKSLFDFDLLTDNITDIEMIEDIKIQCMKCVCSSNKESFLFKSVNMFTSYDYFNGNAYFKPYHIYDNQGKRLYAIYKLVCLQLNIMARTCVYDEYETTNVIKVKSDRDTASIDIDLASWPMQHVTINKIYNPLYYQVTVNNQ